MITAQLKERRRGEEEYKNKFFMWPEYELKALRFMLMR